MEKLKYNSGIIKSWLLISLITVLISLIIISEAISQRSKSVNLIAGPTFSTWGGSDTDGEADYKTGVFAGANFSLPIGTKLYFEPGLLFNMRGFSSKFREKGTGYSMESDFSLSSYYIDVPLNFRLSLIKNFSVYAGPQLSVLLNNKFKYHETECFNGSCTKFSGSESDTEGFRKFDIAFELGFRYQLPAGLNFNLGYNLGFMSLDEDGDSSIYNRQFKLGVGYSIFY